MNNNKSVIRISKDVKYLSEVLKELPKDCLFNKGVVGGGGTTIALTDSSHTVIAVPFKELATNKAIQSLENPMYPYKVLAVTGEVNNDTIIKYVQDNKVSKIIVTYNSLERLMSIIDYSKFNLLIDEYHILFTDYSFRKDACLSVLNNYKKFNSYTFMTATPIEEEFILEELKGIPVVEAIWDNSKEVTIKPIKCVKGVLKTTVSLVNSFLDGEQEGNLYLFVNSVSFIKSVLRKVKVDDSNCRVIYSDNNDTKMKVSRGKTTDAPKKINFITSKAFEGADIYDVDGKVVVVSDSNREHTLLDISTKLIQITGRIRDTKYFDEIYHITSFNRYNENKLTYNEFKESIMNTVEEDEEFINHNKDKFRDYVVKNIQKGLTVFHYLDENGDIKYDSNRIKIDLYNYKITNEVYKNRINLSSAYKESGITSKEFSVVDNSHIEIKNLDDVVNDFKVAVESIKDRYESGEEYISLVMGYYEQFPYILKAISELGFEEIKRMKYRTSNIKRRLDLLDSTKECTSEVDKIKASLRHNTSIKIGEGYTGTELKNLLQKEYDKIGINRKAKGRDIKDFYLTEVKSVREEGKVVKKTFILAKKA